MNYKGCRGNNCRFSYYYLRSKHMSWQKIWLLRVCVFVHNAKYHTSDWRLRLRLRFLTNQKEIDELYVLFIDQETETQT